MNEKLNSGLGRVENIAGKGQNAGYQHFLLFPQCFQKLSLSGSLKVWDCVLRVNHSKPVFRDHQRSPTAGSLGFYVSAVQVF